MLKLIFLPFFKHKVYKTWRKRENDALFVSIFLRSTYYRPQTKIVKVMFIHVSVSHSVHTGGHAWLRGACVVGERVCVVA